MQRARGCGRLVRAASGDCCHAQGPSGGRTTLHKSTLGPLEVCESLWPRGSPVGSTCCPRPPEHVSLSCLPAPWFPGFGASCVVLLLPPTRSQPWPGGRGRGGQGGEDGLGPSVRRVLQQLHPRAWPQTTHSARQCLRVPARIQGSDFHVHHDALLLCEGSDSISALGAQCEPMTAVSRELRAHWVPRPSRALPLHQGDTLLLEFSLCIVTMVTYSGLKY